MRDRRGRRSPLEEFSESRPIGVFGTVVAGFRVESLIGEGAMGGVYLAEGAGLPGPVERRAVLDGFLGLHVRARTFRGAAICASDRGRRDRERFSSCPAPERHA